MAAQNNPYLDILSDDSFLKANNAVSGTDLHNKLQLMASDPSKVDPADKQLIRNLKNKWKRGKSAGQGQKQGGKPIKQKIHQGGTPSKTPSKTPPTKLIEDARQQMLKNMQAVDDFWKNSGQTPIDQMKLAGKYDIHGMGTPKIIKETVAKMDSGGVLTESERKLLGYWAEKGTVPPEAQPKMVKLMDKAGNRVHLFPDGTVMYGAGDPKKQGMKKFFGAQKMDISTGKITGTIADASSLYDSKGNLLSSPSVSADNPIVKRYSDAKNALFNAQRNSRTSPLQLKKAQDEFNAAEKEFKEFAKDQKAFRQSMSTGSDIPSKAGFEINSANQLVDKDGKVIAENADEWLKSQKAAEEAKNAKLFGKNANVLNNVGGKGLSNASNVGKAGWFTKTKDALKGAASTAKGLGKLALWGGTIADGVVTGWNAYDATNADHPELEYGSDAYKKYVGNHANELLGMVDSLNRIVEKNSSGDNYNPAVIDNVNNVLRKQLAEWGYDKRVVDKVTLDSLNNGIKNAYNSDASLTGRGLASIGNKDLSLTDRVLRALDTGSTIGESLNKEIATGNGFWGTVGRTVRKGIHAFNNNVRDIDEPVTGVDEDRTMAAGMVMKGLQGASNSYKQLDYNKEHHPEMFQKPQETPAKKKATVPSGGGTVGGYQNSSLSSVRLPNGATQYSNGAVVAPGGEVRWNNNIQGVPRMTTTTAPNGNLRVTIHPESVYPL